MQLDNKKIKHREEREKKKENKAGLPYIQLSDAQKKALMETAVNWQLLWVLAQTHTVWSLANDWHSNIQTLKNSGTATCEETHPNCHI